MATTGSIHVLFGDRLVIGEYLCQAIQQLADFRALVLKEFFRLVNCANKLNGGVIGVACPCNASLCRKQSLVKLFIPGGERIREKPSRYPFRNFSIRLFENLCDSPKSPVMLIARRDDAFRAVGDERENKDVQKVIPGHASHLQW